MLVTIYSLFSQSECEEVISSYIRKDSNTSGERVLFNTNIHEFINNGARNGVVTEETLGMKCDAEASTENETTPDESYLAETVCERGNLFLDSACGYQLCKLSLT